MEAEDDELPPFELPPDEPPPLELLILKLIDLASKFTFCPLEVESGLAGEIETVVVPDCPAVTVKLADEPSNQSLVCDTLPFEQLILNLPLQSVDTVTVVLPPGFRLICAAVTENELAFTIYGKNRIPIPKISIVKNFFNPIFLILFSYYFIISFLINT